MRILCTLENGCNFFLLEDAGCDIDLFFPCQEMYRVYDLQPSTSYTMEVTAHTDAGSTASVLRFATLTYTGSKFDIYVRI